jgi:hypothetical protein
MPFASVFRGCRSSPWLWMPVASVVVVAVRLSRGSCGSPQLSTDRPVVRLRLLQMTYSLDAVRLRLSRMPIVTVAVDAVCLSRCSCRSPQSWQLLFASVVRLRLLQMTYSLDAVRLRLSRMPSVSEAVCVTYASVVVAAVRFSCCSRSSPLLQLSKRFFQMPFAPVYSGNARHWGLQMPFAVAVRVFVSHGCKTVGRPNPILLSVLFSSLVRVSEFDLCCNAVVTPEIPPVPVPLPRVVRVPCVVRMPSHRARSLRASRRTGPSPALCAGRLCRRKSSPRSVFRILEKPRTSASESSLLPPLVASGRMVSPGASSGRAPACPRVCRF